eukprot:gene6373-4598_t
MPFSYRRFFLNRCLNFKSFRVSSINANAPLNAPPLLPFSSFTISTTLKITSFLFFSFVLTFLFFPGFSLCFRLCVWSEEDFSCVRPWICRQNTYSLSFTRARGMGGGKGPPHQKNSNKHTLLPLLLPTTTSSTRKKKDIFILTLSNLCIPLPSYSDLLNVVTPERIQLQYARGSPTPPSLPLRSPTGEHNKAQICDDLPEDNLDSVEGRGETGTPLSSVPSLSRKWGGDS